MNTESSNAVSFKQITHAEAMDIISSMTDRTFFAVETIEIHRGSYGDIKDIQVLIGMSGSCILFTPFALH